MNLGSIYKFKTSFLKANFDANFISEVFVNIAYWSYLVKPDIRFFIDLGSFFILLVYSSIELNKWKVLKRVYLSSQHFFACYLHVIL